MDDLLPNGERFPEGSDFFKWTWAQEDRCAKITDDRIPEMGVKAPRCLQQLGTVLSLLDRLATCYWGCDGGDHTIEYLAGRACSLGKATLRLLRFGFYDEALSSTRSIGEIANLLFLFDNDGESFAE